MDAAPADNSVNVLDRRSLKVPRRPQGGKRPSLEFGALHISRTHGRAHAGANGGAAEESHRGAAIALI